VGLAQPPELLPARLWSPWTGITTSKTSFVFVTVPYVSPTVHYTAKLRPVCRRKARLKSAFDTSKRCQAPNCSVSHAVVNFTVVKSRFINLSRDFTHDFPYISQFFCWLNCTTIDGNIQVKIHAIDQHNINMKNFGYSPMVEIIWLWQTFLIIWIWFNYYICAPCNVVANASDTEMNLQTLSVVNGSECKNSLFRERVIKWLLEIKNINIAKLNFADCRKIVSPSRTINISQNGWQWYMTRLTRSI